MWKLSTTIGALSAAILAASVQADIHVRRLCFDANGNVASSTVVSTVSAGAQVTIDPSAFSPSCGGDGRATFVVYADSNLENIGRVVFTGPGGLLVNDLLITGGAETEIKVASEMTSTGQDWAGVDPGPYHMQVQARIGRDLTGSVTADNVVRLRIGGAIAASADIKQTDATHPIWSVRAAGDIAGDVWAGDSSTAANGIVLVTSDNGSISGEVRAWAGNVGTVTATAGTISGSINSNRGVVTRIECKNLTGSITANGQLQAPGNYWAINTIDVTEDIGTPTALVSITTDSGPFQGQSTGYDNGLIRKIVARNIYANISTPRPSGPPPYSATNKRGDIVELVTNPDNVADQGRLVGQIDTFSFGYDNNVQDPSMDIHGPMEAVVNLDGTFKQPVKLRGGVTSAGVVSLREQDLTVDNEGIEVTGDMAGRIEIEGNKDAPITISGDVTGTVEIGASVRSAPAANRDYAGRLSVGGSLTSAGVITVGGSVLDAPGRVEIEIADDLDGQISIGKSLAGQIEMGAGGLKGQVIINANNGTGASAGMWTGTVNVGSIQLKPNNTASPDDSAPYYKRHASDLGGGAVGLAPFHLYEGDCSPPHNDFGALPWVLASQFTNLANTPVKIVQYGPVKFNTSGHLALVIEAQNPNDECA